MENRNILISGAGIAGLTLAYWLKKFGFKPTIVEHSPKLREGGYAIDFWGAGFDVAEKMDIVPDVRKADIQISEVSFVDQNNNRKGGLNYERMKRQMKGRGLTLLRSDLARVIYQHLDKDVEIIFGNTITTIEQSAHEITVTLNSGETRAFDLVVGADGLHSIVRSLVFGREAEFEKYYGYYTSSFTIENNIYSGKAFLTYNVPGKQAAIYSFDERKSAVFFIFASPQKLSYTKAGTEGQKQILRNEFENAGWKCGEILSRMDATTDFYFDTVSQIQMNHWSKGRVTLAGDACYCPSLLSGQGSTLAMVGAYMLAGELKAASGDYETAFRQYERTFKPFMERKQKTARTFANSLVPKSNFGIGLRNLSSRIMDVPFVSKWFIKQFMNDDLELATY